MSDGFDVLRGADGPRPLPDHLRQRLETAITGADLAGIDAPRPLPPHLRRRIERSLLRPSRWTRGVAATAALLLIVASAVALGRGLSSRDDDGVAAGRPAQRTETAEGELRDDATSAQSEAAPAATVPPTTAPRALGRASVTATTTAPAAAEAGAAGGGGAAAAASSERATPTVTLSKSRVRRGEEVVARTEHFSTPTATYRLHAPSGRVVLEGEGGTEFRFSVPLHEELGSYTLVVHGSDGREHAEAYLDVVLA